MTGHQPPKDICVALRVRGLVVLFTLLLSSELALADVTIARLFMTEPVAQTIEIGAGKFFAIPLPGGNPGDRYRIEVELRNQVYRDISAYIVDEANLQRFQRRERFIGQGQQKAQAPFAIDHQVMSPGRYYVLLDNSYALLVKKTVFVTTRMATEMPSEAARSMHDGISALYAGLRQLFVFRDFNITVVPCGQANAFSVKATGDITMCTETISKAAGRSGAFAGVLFHEVGHTLLGLWGLPGADNEDMADEFAVQVLIRLRNGADLVREFAEFFADGNPWLEARAIIQRGDRHTISTQRVRNLQAWARDASGLVQRWNRLIYPNMTDEALRAIMARPTQHDDRGLAETELRKRGAMQVSK